MAKLPTKDVLGTPGSFRTGRPIASIDTSGLGRGISAAGQALEGLGAEIRQDENAVDIARAEAYKTQQLLETQNAFEDDPDYATFRKRAPERTGEIVKNGAQIIRDPQMRERWAASAQADAARTNDSIFDRGRTIRRQAETVAFDEALEVNRRLYVDPDTDEATKAKARSDIEGSIQAGLASGLLTPEQAAARRETYIDNADFSRGQLAIERDPDVVPGSRGPIGRLISTKAQQYGVPPEIAIGIAQIESGMNPNAKAATSSAGGLFQFIDSTASQYGLTNKLDADANADAGVRLTRDNINGLRRELGREPTPGEVYLAHFSGFGAARKLGAASPDTPTDQIFSPQAIRANASILRGKTAGEVRAWADRKMASAMRKGGAGEEPDWFQRLSPEAQAKLQREADAARTRKNVELQGFIEVATNNAPVAIQNTGRYDGALPSIEQFVDAYGPQDGAQKYSAFQAAVDTAQTAHEMRTMSPAQIQETVAAAAPVSSGDDAALEQKRFEVISGAASATLKLRNADPSTYTQQTFPDVARAWNDLDAEGGYQTALAATAAAQRQLGIEKMRLLPANLADSAVEKFANEELPEDQRIAAVTQTILGTSDPEQRRALFEQLVEAGLPDITEGAIEAAARGDEGAARRLFRAAMIDPAKLPGQSPEKPADIDEAIQSQLMDVGELGDVYYGLSEGVTENFVRAQRDQKLIHNAVQVRIRKGEALSSAIDAVAKDLYGDVKVVTGNRAVNAQILLPSDQDGDAVINGLEGLLPTVQGALNTALALPSAAPAGDFDGLVEQGNIDLAKRPRVQNEDGSISTVRSMSFNVDGVEVLIPTVLPDGRVASDAEAIQHYRETGEHLGKFETPQAATAYANALHDAQEQFFLSDGSTRAVLDATTQNYIDNVMAEGYFRNAGDGFVFIDPYTGLAVSDAEGRPITFSVDQAISATPIQPPQTEQDLERQFLEERSNTFGTMGGAQ